jgi:hypothetical protein
MEGGSLAMSAGANTTIFRPIRSSCMHKCIFLLILRFLWSHHTKTRRREWSPKNPTGIIKHNRDRKVVLPPTRFPSVKSKHACFVNSVFRKQTYICTCVHTYIHAWVCMYTFHSNRSLRSFNF